LDKAVAIRSTIEKIVRELRKSIYYFWQFLKILAIEKIRIC
jgi:hypothetical protein